MSGYGTPTVERFFNDQLTTWPEAASRYDALKNAETKTIGLDGFNVTVQFNPARIVSSAAKTDAVSIGSRPCFLCDANRPAVQRSIDLDGYRILVNPFPIMPFHLTVPAINHVPQLIAGHYDDMRSIAANLPGIALFYNGPRCGASAPDHLHFQAVRSADMPLIDAVESGLQPPFGIIVLDDADAAAADSVIARLPRDSDEDEPKMNIFIYRSDRTGKMRTIIIPRRRHRPDFYGDKEGMMLVSPASIDLGGIMVAPRRQDFEMLDRQRLVELYTQLCYTKQQTDDFIS